MILYLLITLVTVWLAYFVNNAIAEKTDFDRICGRGSGWKTRREMLNGVFLTGIFLILFTVSALRVGIGSDYWVYRYDFLHIIDGDTKVSYEVGFKLLVRALQGLFGYDNYKIIFAFMAFLTCLLFLKGLFAISDWFVMTFFLFMANGFYFMSFSNVRYYFVLAITAYAMKYLFQKDYVRFVAWIVFAAFFHKSVLLVIPAYLIAYYLKWNKKTIWLIPAVSLVLGFGKFIVRRLVFIFYPFYEGDPILDVETISYVNIAKCFAILIFALLFYRKAIWGNPKAETFFNLNLFALLLYSLGYYIPETSRICYYMIFSHVYLIPIVLKSIEGKKKRLFFVTSVILAYSGYLLIFLEKSKDGTVLLLPYLNWLL